MQYRPAGPSMDIKLISGELQEIHLPHFLCLGGSQSFLKDAVMVLHKQDSGVCLEKCELSRFHARLVNPSFSILGLFYSLISFLLPGKEVKIHADVQVYRCSTNPLTFRFYLLPEDAGLSKLLTDQEDSFRGFRLFKPRPLRPLQMNEFYGLHTTPECIRMYPVELDLRVSEIAPNFSEVRRSEAGDFKMKLSSADDQTVWEAQILKTECFWNEPQQGGESALDAAEFLSNQRPALIQKVRNVKPIADEMLSQKLIAREVYDKICAGETEQDKMRRVFDALNSREAKGKFLKILQRECPDVLRELRRISS
ncbi:NACHT, LRR and PYD domains-containing protein 1 homolog [Clupea harengus]|uniref:NACHT, LRR and PYD domains-containing protein 1 homolog n=1 Tax=Clupea harengus TaxID=7950 RepID=A0A8M1KBF7_CLUHA|nr:NACHT, LRR and PYD domains-containing protein 1 homolog [Clupea harengus]